MSKKFVQFKAPEHMWQFLTESAEEGCTSMATIIRNLIFAEMKKKESMDKAA